MPPQLPKYRQPQVFDVSPKQNIPIPFNTKAIVLPNPIGV
jgi:hypothetical protein